MPRSSRHCHGAPRLPDRCWYAARDRCDVQFGRFDVPQRARTLRRRAVLPLVAEVDVRAVLPTVRVPTLVVHHTDDPVIPPEWGKYVADHISGAKYVELPGRDMYHFVEPWRASFQEIHEFLTGHQADVADDRVLATVLFTDIVDSTRRAAEVGDRDWHALLDAHDAVVRPSSHAFEAVR